MAASLRTVFGLAKSPELQLTDDELHWVCEAHTGKDSLAALNRRELQTLIRVLISMKDKQKKVRREAIGNSETAAQRRKIYMLTKELGWEKQARVNGMCKKMFGIERIEWLNHEQCSALIEALKSMVKRKEGQHE